MKNTYLTSYLPLLAIILFSLSLSIRVELTLMEFLKEIGVYVGMREFFSEGGIRFAFLALLLVLFFMVFAALKLIADTINELSLLFFSKESEGASLRNIRIGSIIYFVGGALSLTSMYSYFGMALIFVSTTVAYFIFFVFKVSSTASVAGIIGLIFFQVITWSTLLCGIVFVGVKVYNSVIASLPI